MSSELSSKRILLVGSSGRVGRFLKATWDLTPPKDCEIIYQYRTGAVGHDKLVWSPLDGPDALAAWVDQYGPIDAMIMLAGATPGPNVDHSVDAKIALAALRAADAQNVKRVLIASSSAVYGAETGQPFRETDTPKPLSEYGQSKLEMEQTCRAADRPHPRAGMTFLRIGNVFGADALMQNAIVADGRKPLILERFPNGRSPRRSYIGPVTLARILVELVGLDGDLPAILNIGHPQAIYMRELLVAADVSWEYKDIDTNGKQNIVLDCSALAELVSFPATDDLGADMFGELSLLEARGATSKTPV